MVWLSGAGHDQEACYRTLSRLGCRPLSTTERSPASALRCWGTGHFLLREQFLERDLGLRCALNLLTAGAQPGQWDAARLRSVRAKRVGLDVLITESQTARLAPLESFAFSAEVDQFRAVTGVPLDSDRWGKSVTGGLAAHVRRPGEVARLTLFFPGGERGCSH